MTFWKTLAVSGAAIGVIGAGIAVAQQGRAKEEYSWAPKPLEKTVYKAPHKPHTKIKEVRAANAGKKEWTHTVVDDDYLKSQYIQQQPGAKVGPRFRPDTREWWVILDGQIRFEIEGEQPFVATRGSMVQVPAQTIYSFETIGDKPSLRFETNIPGAKILYPKTVEPPKMAGWTYLPVTLRRKPFGYSNGNKPHINLWEEAKNPQYKGGRFVHDDRAVSNIIYGRADSLPKVDESLPTDEQARKGHYHPECAEFWLIMQGQIRYPIEYHGVVIAEEGDVVYVPKFTFHAPRWWGEGFSTRLAMNGYTNISHLFKAVVD